MRVCDDMTSAGRKLWQLEPEVSSEAAQFSCEGKG